VLRPVDARRKLSDRSFELARHFRGAAFAAVHALHKLPHRFRDRVEPSPGLGDGGLRRDLPGVSVVRLRCHRCGLLLAYFVGACIHDDLVQPRAERHARPPCGLLGRLARLGLNTLDAPWNPRSHPNHYVRLPFEAV